jgi:hypothetical protein
VLECKEDEEKEGCANMVMGEGYMPEREWWGGPKHSWLEMDKEEEEKSFYVNLLMEEGEPRRMKRPPPPCPA